VRVIPRQTSPTTVSKQKVPPMILRTVSRFMPYPSSSRRVFLFFGSFTRFSLSRRDRSYEVKGVFRRGAYDLRSLFLRVPNSASVWLLLLYSMGESAYQSMTDTILSWHTLQSLPTTGDPRRNRNHWGSHPQGQGLNPDGSPDPGAGCGITDAFLFKIPQKTGPAARLTIIFIFFAPLRR